MAGEDKKPARRGARRGRARLLAEDGERGQIALHQRIGSCDLRFVFRKELPALGDLRADEEAGEIFTRVVFGESAHEGQATGAEQGGEEAKTLAADGRGAAPHAEFEGGAGRFRARRAGESAGDRVVPDRCEEFAGDERPEAFDAPILDNRPLGMRAGQDYQAGAGIRDAKISTSSPRITSGSPPASSYESPGASRTRRAPASTATSPAAIALRLAGHFT